MSRGRTAGGLPGPVAKNPALTKTSIIDMLIYMRTTLVLDGQLVREAKKRAADAGLTFSELVNRVLRDAFVPRDETAPPFEMITHGHHGPEVRHEPDDLAEALEHDDAASLGRGR